MKTERRSLNATLNAVDDSKFQIVGTAAAYNTLSHDLGGFKEVIAPGAFTRSLKSNPDVKCLMNHDANIVLGRTRSGTLVLSDSRDGLRFLCQLDKSQQSHKDLYASVKRGDISECSFAFAVNGEGQTWTRDQKQRTLTDVNLFDVSIVTNPAYPTGTSVQVRSAQYRSAARPRTESEMLQLMDVFHRARVKQIGFLIRMADATERMNIHMAQTIHDQQSARVAKLGQEIREQQGPGMDDEDISASERERMVH